MLPMFLGVPAWLHGVYRGVGSGPELLWVSAQDVQEPRECDRSPGGWLVGSTSGALT